MRAVMLLMLLAPLFFQLRYNRFHIAAVFKVGDENGIRGFYHNHIPQAIGSYQAIMPESYGVYVPQPV